MNKFLKVIALSAAAFGLAACSGNATIESYVGSKGYVEEAYAGDVVDVVAAQLDLIGSSYVFTTNTLCAQVGGNIVHNVRYVVEGSWKLKSEDKEALTKTITLSAATKGYKVVDGSKTELDAEGLGLHVGKGGDYVLHTDTNSFDLVYVQGILF